LLPLSWNRPQKTNIRIMNTPNDGGPAFPQPCFVNLDDDHPTLLRGNIECAGGMSLRDWFAGMALQGRLASMSDRVMREVQLKTATDCGKSLLDSMATLSYCAADAMLKAREVKP